MSSKIRAIGDYPVSTVSIVNFEHAIAGWVTCKT